MSVIHPSAVVDRRAELGPDVQIGPFCYVGPDVVLGEGCILHAHVTLFGPASFGSRNEFYPHCTLGSPPQDLKYRGGPTRLVVGDGNIFREQVTVHRGTEVDRQSGGITRIGSHNLLMVGVHIAHDAELGSHLIIANQVQLAGHVRIENCVTVGGGTAMHHFVTVGRYAYVAGVSRITHDVPPYMKVEGYDQEVRAVNVTGMQRWRIGPESITAVKAAFRLLFARRGNRSPGRTAEAIRQIEANGLLRDEHVAYLVEFLKRKLAVGVFGRVREHYRSDRPEDRANFYGLARLERAPRSAGRSAEPRP